MRYYALDDLVDPIHRRTLTVVQETRVDRPGPVVERCRAWCGYLGMDPSGARAEDCAACGQLSVVSGWLSAGDRRYPIRDGIPRLRPEDGSDEDAIGEDDRAVREGFGFEWQRFADELPEYEAESRKYFHLVPPERFVGATVLDAGCGMGRWARYAARRSVRRLYALDYSSSIDQAQRYLDPEEVVQCVQADIRFLPIRDSAVHLAYSLGVLHHMPNPDDGMMSLLRVLKPQGGLLVYLYYSLENRPAHYRAILSLINAVRRTTSRLPKRVMYWLAWSIALGVYWPLARLSLVFDVLGRRNVVGWIPLHDYRRRSIRLMALDAFDRFATPLERRYSRSEVRSWLERHGLQPRFSESSPFWVAYAEKP